MIHYGKTKLAHHSWTRQTEGEESKSRYRNHRPTHPHTQESHRNTKLEAIICPQRPCPCLNGI